MAEAQESSDRVERANLEAEQNHAEWTIEREHYIDVTATPLAQAPMGGPRDVPQP